MSLLRNLLLWVTSPAIWKIIQHNLFVYAPPPLLNRCNLKSTSTLIRAETRRPTVREGEAVHDGHPIEPVLVAGVAHGQDARAVPQQRAPQPARHDPCATTSGEKHREVRGASDRAQPVGGSQAGAPPLTSARCASGLSAAFLQKSMLAVRAPPHTPRCPCIANHSPALSHAFMALIYQRGFEGWLRMAGRLVIVPWEFIWKHKRLHLFKEVPFNTSPVQNNQLKKNKSLKSHWNDTTVLDCWFSFDLEQTAIICDWLLLVTGSFFIPYLNFSLLNWKAHIDNAFLTGLVITVT